MMNVTVEPAVNEIVDPMVISFLKNQDYSCAQQIIIFPHIKKVKFCPYKFQLFLKFFKTDSQL